MNELDKIFELIEEFRTNLHYRNKLVRDLTALEKGYQKKWIGYSEYERKRHQLLKNRKLEDWIAQYNSYLVYLLEQIKLRNSQLFYAVYNDKKIDEKLKEPVVKVEPKIEVKPEPVKTSKSAKKILKKKEPVLELPKEKPTQKFEILDKPSIIPETKIPTQKEKKSVELAEVQLLKKQAEKPKPLFTRQELAAKAKLFEKKVEQRGFEVYRPSKFGMMANKYFRPYGEYLIQKYPDFFERLYKALRLADMKILSNTYVNIILLITSWTFVKTIVFFFFVGLFGLSFYSILIRPILLAVLFSISAFIITYTYPFLKADRRAKIIEANLPFAINHLAAIATSGLPPSMMFRVVSRGMEYKETSVELKKLVEYIDFFGYDLTTAMSAVASSTPSRQFKEFLEGCLATITSGGDLKLFLKEKSEQTMFAYKLNREKYSQTVATYSDIYMGVMIVAPVFLIAILSLISILGGTIAGFDIQTLIVSGTYFVIPMLNIIFLLYLHVSQPLE